jgi:membrane-associated protein
MDYLYQFADFFIHLDKHLGELVQAHGDGTYLILFLIVFCETGLVVTPLLPGDSLLFAAGAIAALGSLNPAYLAGVLILAALSGDLVNYHIGKFLGPAAFKNPNSRIFKQAYLDRTRAFYDRYGGKTIIIARFVPIVRTFAPFLAGVGKMKFSYYVTYCIIGAFAWVLAGVYAGYFFGGVPFVKANFTLVIFAIIIISLLPAVFELIRARRGQKKQITS